MSAIRSMLGNTVTDSIKRIVYGRKRRKREARAKERLSGRAKFLSRFIQPGGIGAELGVFKGDFSPFLASVLQPSKLHLVDPWYLLSAEWTWADGNRSTVDALCGVLQAHKGAIERGTVVVHVGDDRDVLESFPDGYLDWAYVDSSHAYQHTKDELAILQRKVKRGGVVCGDDWQPDPAHRHHGVSQAVQELLAERRHRLLGADLSLKQWAIANNE